MKKNLRGMKQNLSQDDLQRIAQQADPTAVHSVQKVVDQYQVKIEAELLHELQRMTGSQRATGNLDDARMQQIAGMISPMLTPEQQQRMAQILNNLK